MTRNRWNRMVLGLMILLLTVPLLSACGKKGKLQTPEGKETDYPRKYPSY